MTETVTLTGGPPWGFRIMGTASSNSFIVVSQVNPDSVAAKAGLRSRDIILAINGIILKNCNLQGAMDIIRNSPGTLQLQLKLASVFDLNPRKSHPVQATKVEAETVQKKIIQPKPKPNPKPNIRRGDEHTINELMKLNNTIEQKPTSSLDKTALLNEIVAPTNVIGFKLASTELQSVLGDDFDNLKAAFDELHKTLADIIDSKKD